MSKGGLILPTVRQIKEIMANNFVPQITPFDGDPQLIHFFFNQVEELARENGWSPQKTMIFFKSKLIGTALQYFIQSDCAQQGQTLDHVKKSFIAYFSDESPQVSIMDLTSFHLLQGESIKAMSHRLDSLIHRIYKDVTDKNSILQIKRTHILQALPLQIKTKIMEENITTYDRTVQRAQELQSIHASAIANPSSSTNSRFEELAQKVNFISEQVSVIKSSQDNSRENTGNCKRSPPHKSGSHGYHSRDKRAPNHKDNKFEFRPGNEYRKGEYSKRSDGSVHNHRWFSKNRSFTDRHFQRGGRQGNRFSNSNFSQRDRNISICHFCNRRGHEMAKCFQFLRMINNGQHATQNYNLNPEAAEFRPNLNGQRG